MNARFSVVAFFLVLLSFSSAALAGFASSTLGARTMGSDTLIRIPDAGVTSGIEHDLDEGDWLRFRVRVKHADSALANIGWTSDEFAPTSENVQICSEEGCEAPEINVGSEELDWEDLSAVTIQLEAKSCKLCAWVPYDVSPQ